MTLTDYAIKNPEMFFNLVRELRKFGVAKLGALVLGPEPREVVAREPAEVDPFAAAHRHHDVMFAASRIRPPFVAPVASTADRPRAIVQRQARDEAAGGSTSKSKR